MFSASALARLAPFSAVPVRLAIGVIFMAHGGDKLFNWFGGGGFTETANGFTGLMGPVPGWLLAAMAGGGELLGGILVFLGLFTRFGAFLLAAVMSVAIVKVHWSAGLFARDNGFEYPLTLLAASLGLLMSGAGPFSLDSVFSIQIKKH
jgi:putative oxidoreductase